MEHQEGRLTGRRNFNLYYRYWLPTGVPKAVLVVVHGLAEHSGRYLHLADRFVPLGYAVYAGDHRGHGRSAGVRGYVDRFSDYAEDLKSFIEKVRGEQKEIPVFLIGHSMGGTIATAYTLEHQDRISGLILSGPALKPGDSISALGKVVARALSATLPKMRVRALDAAGISRDQTVVRAYQNDPLVYNGKLSARLGAEFLREMERLPPQMNRINLPLLVMYGSADRMANPAGCRALYDMVTSGDKTLKSYEGFFHEIFNDPEHDRVFDDMAEWLAGRT